MSKNWILYIALLAITVAAPFLFPSYTAFLATLWLFIVVAQAWDMTGGQMGYNSLGNIFFYGTGMYAGAVFAIGLYYNVGEWTDASRSEIFSFTAGQYYTGMVVGIIGAGLFCGLCALIIGPLFFGLRGPYFAIGTLGLAIAAGEIVSNIEWLGGGQGISMPHSPLHPDFEKVLIYFLFAGLGVVLFIFCKWFYSTRFGAAINAIRDDEEKAEAMGIHTLRYKTITWAISAVFVGAAGAVSAFQLIHFEPLETAYQTINLGIFMVVCVLLGGKGTLWGPVIGAILFHVFKEVTWNYFLGGQWVALGLLIVIIVVFFQDGLMGYLKHRRPEWFGIKVESKDKEAAA
ncbi:Branched-chain amino acid transport system permease protein LivM [Candidatus Rhodobacter oscarellae]|uniref:Branched-chain amino acid transport system permease protein LivM n=1 Tax=Candidatus Rhodobacter oscarellae TaxID=1675527 RepID=A0A0J9E7W8_9RHOB|nr:branched-chain amino acid ABC transporter permease [Candidatus Rhodobacter lobularis]KMW58826.1 Branched-chain amino acid transport system permease protein LivM [Candidatus Rhodobacter lobularis]